MFSAFYVCSVLKGMCSLHFDDVRSACSQSSRIDIHPGRACLVSLAHTFISRGHQKKMSYGGAVHRFFFKDLKRVGEGELEGTCVGEGTENAQCYTVQPGTVKLCSKFH